MNTITIDQAIDTVSQLPLDQQEMLIEIFRKRHIAARRAKIAYSAQESLSLFREGKLTAQSADDVIYVLHTSIDKDDDA